MANFVSVTSVPLVTPSVTAASSSLLPLEETTFPTSVEELSLLPLEETDSPDCLEESHPLPLEESVPPDSLEEFHPLHPLEESTPSADLFFDCLDSELLLDSA